MIMNETSNTDNFSDQEIRDIYKLKNIAVVGMSPTDGKPSNYVPKFLIEKGYNVIPVNPNYSNILNKKSYSKVSEIPENIVIWIQKGINNKEGEVLASNKCIKVLYNRCMLEEHKRLFK